MLLLKVTYGWAEQSGVKGLAQNPNSDSLVVQGFDVSTFWPPSITACLMLTLNTSYQQGFFQPTPSHHYEQYALWRSTAQAQALHQTAPDFCRKTDKAPDTCWSIRTFHFPFLKHVMVPIVTKHHMPQALCRDELLFLIFLIPLN